MNGKGMTIEEFESIDRYKREHFLNFIYNEVRRFKEQPGGAEMLKQTIDEIKAREGKRT